jgi:hypothetical protein
MDNPTAKDLPQKEAMIIEVKESSVEKTCGRYFRGKSQGYWKDTVRMMKIVDKDGKEYEGVWCREWTWIAPGIETRRPDVINKWGRQESVEDEAIRIQRSACPVWVKFHSTSKLTDYDGDGDYSEREYWHRYDAG